MDMPVKVARDSNLVAQAKARSQARSQSQAQAEAEAQARRQFLSFILGRETFAMDIQSVKEIIQLDGITDVPLMPSCIRGVINLRGTVVPVLDLAVRFGRPASDAGKRSCIVVLELEHQGAVMELGMMVDSVCEVLELGEADLEPAPAFGSAMDTALLAGVAKVGGAFLLVLDITHLLDGDLARTLAAEPAC